jgi:hypothetical protein
MKWNHIIEDESIKEHLLCIIRSIAKDLATCSMDYPGLLDGESGISLFWEYLFLYSLIPISVKFISKSGKIIIKNYDENGNEIKK